MSSDTLEPGFRLGKYEVLAHVATGGMGAVYKARDLELGRTVALKVLPSHLAQNPRVFDRFRREARHAALLNHPNIVTLFECGYDPGVDLNYLAMEFIDGIDLEDHIRRRERLPPSEVRHILIRVNKALSHAFEQGMVHRDIKPSNILLARTGDKIVVKLTDLGLARMVDDDEFKVTRDGSTVGTIDYLAPEQARDSRSADIRSDIYSLGCTAFHMLAGHAPFAEGGLGERVYKHMNVPPEDVRLHSPNVSAEFWRIIAKMLAKNPADRYQSPAALHTELKRVTADASKQEANKTTLERTERRKTEHAPSPTPQASSATLDGVPIPVVPSAAESNAASADPNPPPDSDVARAAAFHERAIKALVEGGADDYARQLLDSCLSLAPFNIGYRKTLREFNRKASGAMLNRWFGPLTTIAIRSRMHHAKTNGQWRKVLDHGEELLAQQPSDTEAHFEMLNAALNLNQPSLAIWLQQQGLQHVRNKAAFLRSLAQFFETRQDWKSAIAAWENVRDLDPHDRDANLKINALTAHQHLAGGYYQQ